MANNKSIRILRGSEEKIKSSTDTLVAGQLLYHMDTNQLSCGAAEDDPINKEVITTDHLIAYNKDNYTDDPLLEIKYDEGTHSSVVKSTNIELNGAVTTTSPSLGFKSPNGIKLYSSQDKGYISLRLITPGSTKLNLKGDTVYSFPDYNGGTGTIAVVNTPNTFTAAQRFEGAVTAANGVTVTKGVTTDTLTCSNKLSTGQLEATTNSYLKYVYADSILANTGVSNLEISNDTGTISVYGSGGVDPGIILDGYTSVKDDLDIEGALTVNDSLTVNNSITATGAINASAGLNVSGNLLCDGIVPNKDTVSFGASNNRIQNVFTKNIDSTNILGDHIGSAADPVQNAHIDFIYGTCKFAKYAEGQESKGTIAERLDRLGFKQGGFVLGTSGVANSPAIVAVYREGNIVLINLQWSINNPLNVFTNGESQDTILGTITGRGVDQSNPIATTVNDFVPASGTFYGGVVCTSDISIAPAYIKLITTGANRGSIALHFNGTYSQAIKCKITQVVFGFKHELK